MSAHSNYDAYVNFGKDILNDNQKQQLYNDAVNNNNMKLFNILYKSGYMYPEFDNDLAEWYSNNKKHLRFKKIYNKRNSNSPLQSMSSEEDEYYAPDSNESKSSSSERMG